MKRMMFFMAFLAAPLAAQDQDLGTPVAEGGEVETIGTGESEAEDAGLSFTVTDESDWADLGVAIPGFATDRDVPTPASRSGTGELHHPRLGRRIVGQQLLLAVGQDRGDIDHAAPLPGLES